MKKIVLGVLAAIVAVAAFVFGPGLLDLYRLDRHIQSSAQSYEQDRGSWPQASDACTGCHGVQGNSLNPNYPSLAGQPAAYLAGQLRRFASGERVSPVMNALARALREEQIGALADYFARQAAIDNPYFEPDRSLLESGRPLAGTGACAACHGEGLMGRDQAPRLAGLGYDYLLRQLDGFADGRRRDPTGTMNALAASWSPEQRRAIAGFLAGQAVAPDPTPAAH